MKNNKNRIDTHNWIPKFHRVLFVIWSLILGSLVITLFSCCNGDMNDRKSNRPNLYYKDTTINKDTCFICNKTTFLNLLIKKDVAFPEIVCAQAILETGWFKSNAFKQYNNPFGFKLNDTTFVKFYSINQSVEYYKKWQAKHFWNNYYYGKGIATNELYYKFLDEYHYSINDSSYIGKLKRIEYNL